MASTQLPTPGRLVIENITLLAGSPTAFHARYGFTLTPTTFSKPGNTASANAVLHFLITIIDADVADSLFKPCFPILDRDQERDFRKVVDARLAILERTKLIPTGCARKSVVSAAGGDRFLDLLWSLSSLALQQACLRHPAYASVSRMRLLSQAHSDTSSQHSASQYPASRSSRSLLSARSSRSERPPPGPSPHRRFLGVGMLSGSQQRQRDAEQMRARIDSERIALNRTTEMGQQGAKTWASEADSLRERICEFEAKLRRLKGQLADMGFDQNGNDLRVKTSPTGDITAISETKPAIDGTASGGPLVTSPSGDDLLKTSPIESTESCSSVDDAGDLCEDLAADLSRLLTFTVESGEQRVDVEEAVEVEQPDVPFAIVSNTELLCEGKDNVEVVAQQNPKDIVELVRVATDELEEATNRMHEIREARDRSEMDPDPEVEADRDVDSVASEEASNPLADVRQQCENEDEKGTEEEQEFELSEKPVGELSEKTVSEPLKETASELFEKTASEVSEKIASVATATEGDDNMFGSERPTIINGAAEPPSVSKVKSANVLKPVFEVEDASPKGEDAAAPISDAEDACPSLDTPSSLEQKVGEVLEGHNFVLGSSRQLQKEAAILSAKAGPSPNSEDGNSLANPTSRHTFVEAISKPHWYTNAMANSARGKKSSSPSSATKKHGKPPRGHASTLSDVSVAAKAMQGYGSSYPSRASTARRRKEGTRSLDSINLDAIEKRSSPSPGNEMDVLCSPSESNSSLKGTPRSVRFAELPPSYSASRTSDNSRESSPVRNRGDSNVQFMESVSRALECRSENKEPEAYPGPGKLKEQVGASVPGDSAETEPLSKEGGSIPATKKPSRPLRKYEGVLRPDMHAVKTENGRAGTVSSQKPPRVQRTRTPHRAGRSQDAGQRLLASRQQSSATSLPTRPFSSRSASADSISSLRTSRSSANATKGSESELSVRNESRRLEEKPTPPDPQSETPDQVSYEKALADAKSETHSPQASTVKMVGDIICPKKEPVQKKLFMTPETAVSSKTTLHLSRLTRRASSGAHSWDRSNAASLSNISKPCDVTAVVKEASAEFPSVDEEELLFSPASKPPLPEKSATTKVSSGFFAGQTAQWQQSVRAQSNIGQQKTAAASSSMSENSGRPSRNPGKATSSGMKGRVQSLRARLAALK